MSHEAERSLIAEALAQCAGNKSRAAQLLGISRASLARKLREHELARSNALHAISTAENPRLVELAKRAADDDRGTGAHEVGAAPQADEHRLAQVDPGRLLIPPGSRIRHWLRAIVSRQVYEHDIVQTIADAQIRWLEAHKRGDLQLARAVRVRMFVRLGATLANRFLGDLLHSALGIFRSG